MHPLWPGHHGQTPKYLLLVNVGQKDLIGNSYFVVNPLRQVGLVVKPLSVDAIIGPVVVDNDIDPTPYTRHIFK